MLEDRRRVTDEDRSEIESVEKVEKRQRIVDCTVYYNLSKDLTDPKNRNELVARLKEYHTFILENKVNEETLFHHFLFFSQLKVVLPDIFSSKYRLQDLDYDQIYPEYCLFQSKEYFEAGSTDLNLKIQILALLHSVIEQLYKLSIGKDLNSIYITTQPLSEQQDSSLCNLSDLENIIKSFYSQIYKLCNREEYTPFISFNYIEVLNLLMTLLQEGKNPISVYFCFAEALIEFGQKQDPNFDFNRFILNKVSFYENRRFQQKDNHRSTNDPIQDSQFMDTLATLISSFQETGITASSLEAMQVRQDNPIETALESIMESIVALINKRKAEYDSAKQVKPEKKTKN
jgi:hypothetical protein